MNQLANRQWILAKRPQGMTDASLFELRTTPVPPLIDGQILAQTLYLSFDPTQRAWMAMDTYMPAVELGEPMRASGILQVIDSKHPKYKTGDLINYLCGWQEYVVINPDVPALAPLNKIPPYLDPALVLALSLTGLTAYFGLLDVGKPKPGDTVLVSGAAGATGSIAGQIAKLKGCRVVGIAGSDEKCKWLTQKAKFDATINYKTEDLNQQLHALCPDGVDIYFDNVGGETLDEVLLHLAMNARIVVCGAISQYNKPEDLYGIKNYLSLIIRRASAEGFIVLDYLDRATEGLLCLNKWVENGKIVQNIDMQHDFEQIPGTLKRLFTGENLGKQLLKLSDPPLPLRKNRLEATAFRLLSAYISWRKA